MINYVNYNNRYRNNKYAHKIVGKNFNCLEESSVSIGVRNTAIDGNNNKLIKAIHDTIYDVINKKNFTINNIDLILASGMLTSNVGILEIPHKNAPIRLEDLSKSMVRKTINEILYETNLVCTGNKEY